MAVAFDLLHPDDTPVLRKARGAFFTPEAITRFIAEWAIRSSDDRVLEPSSGDAEFLVAAAMRLRGMGVDQPAVDGVEIHEHSARVGADRVRGAGGDARIEVGDFFAVGVSRRYDAVIGNPPYIRYQDFTGQARAASRQAALRAGVALTGLASSWAAFTVHATSFLRPGGRLGLVLPAELLSVNYAAPVRSFLFERFRDVEVVLFDEQVFPEAEADVVLLLADGFGEGPAAHGTFRYTRNAATLAELDPGTHWSPDDPSVKWVGNRVPPRASAAAERLRSAGFAGLQGWGETTLGMVTGNNRFFALSPDRVAELALPPRELRRLSPPGSAHLRTLALTGRALAQLGREGQATHLFRPGARPSDAALAYIEMGEHTGVDRAYKCRVRKTWYQVPLLAPADLLLTCMNADTPRLTANEAGALHLNSVHGVYLREEVAGLGRELLPVASLNSATMLDAELVGRAYGGGILKIEPREADRWAVPSPELVAERAAELRAVKPEAARLLRRGERARATALVDEVLLVGTGLLTADDAAALRAARDELALRRTRRGASRRG